MDLTGINSLPELLETTTKHLDTLFPNSTGIPSHPPVDPISESSSIFITERSLSLWSQLVAPPPLQPPNWVKSRIRRLFLISLGVPVDLDEILPASKQKKLVLPSINSEGQQTGTTTDGSTGSGGKLKPGDQQRSSNSFESGRSTSRNQTYRRRGPQPPPDLDLSAMRRLCTTTDAALAGFTDDEMRTHVSNLDDMKARAGQVLDYWLKQRDSQVGEKEAYEGVIENLVKHARQVRK